MTRNMGKIWNDEAGFVVSAELVLVLTIAVLAMVVGLAAVRDAVTNELNDVSHAIGSISQSFSVSGLEKSCHSGHGYHARVSGSAFRDRADNCDCQPIELISVQGKTDSSRGPAE